MWIYLNDAFLQPKDALISVFDHGFLYGDGVYETLRSYGSRLFLRDQHLARLTRSAEAIGLNLPIPNGGWPALLHELMARNDLGNDGQDAYIRITVSRGEGEIGLDPALCPTPTMVIMTKPLTPPARTLYEKGVDLIVAETRRNLPEAISPRIKATSYLNNILAKREAIRAGVFDSILLNRDDQLTECTVSNLFFVTGGGLHTPSPDCGLLDGLTRGLVIQLAGELGMEVEEGRFTPDRLYRATECFLTNTSMEIMPVTSVDRNVIGRGIPGPVTRTLQEQFNASRERFLEPAFP